MRKSLATVVCAAGLAIPVSVGAQEFDLKISHMFPSTHFVQTLVMEPWAEEIEERTDGRVKFTFFAAGSSLGDATRQFDQVRAGVVDIAIGIPAIPRGRHPRTVLMEMPFTLESSYAGTNALHDIYDEHLAEDFPGTVMLSLTPTQPSAIHMGTEVAAIEDIAGLRVRAPTPSVTEMLEEIGATPVGMPPTQIYESVERGIIDGNVMPWGPVGAFKLWEVLNYHLDARVDTVTMYTLMNENTYNSLPEDIRAVFDEMGREWFRERWPDWWVETDQIAIDAARENGNTIIEVSDEEREQWRERMQPVIERYLEEQTENLPNAREIYGAMVEAVSKYE